MRNALLAACLLAALPRIAVAQSARSRPPTVSSPTLGEPTPSPSSLTPTQLAPPPRSGGDAWGNDVEVSLPALSPVPVLVAQTDSAVERRSQAFAESWMVTEGAQLFSRPTFGERFKVSSESTWTEDVFSMAASPLALANPYMTKGGLGERLLWGTQVLATVAPDSKEVSLGVKVNYNLADVRGLSPEEQSRLSTAPEGLELALEEAQNFKPLVSLGIAGGRNFSTQRWGRFAANLSVEVPFRDASLVVNVDAANTELTVDRRRWSTSGTLAATWSPLVPFLPNPIQLSAAGKYTTCVMDCDPFSATVRFGPTLGYSLTKDTLVAASLSWEARSNTLGVSDVLLGLALSHSFGLEKNEAGK